MTLQEIEAIPKEILTPEDIRKFLGATPNAIRAQAQADPRKLGFPVIVQGSRVRIPKAGFVFYCRYGRAMLPAEAVLGKAAQ